MYIHVNHQHPIRLGIIFKYFSTILSQVLIENFLILINDYATADGFQIETLLFKGVILSVGHIHFDNQVIVSFCSASIFRSIDVNIIEMC